MQDEYYSDSNTYDTNPTTTTTTVTYEEPDYSNDQGAYGSTNFDDSRSKGKKGKSKNRNKEANKKKKILKEIKKKLLKEIDVKQKELNEKAVLLEDRIGGLELDIEDSKHTITDLEDRLDGIQYEMDQIQELKSNVTSLMKNRKQFGKDGAPEIDTFLLPNIETAPEELSQALKDLLVKEKDKRSRHQLIGPPMSHDLSHGSADEILTNEIALRNKMADLNESSDNLGKITGAEVDLDRMVDDGSG